MCGVSQGYAVCCRWTVLGMLVTGIVFSCLAAGSCDFVEVDDGIDDIQNVGLYRYQSETGSCVQYADDREYGDSEQKARTAAAIAPLCASFALLLLLIEFVCCRFPCSTIVVGMSLLAAQISQGLTFLFFGSENFCGSDLVEEIMEQKPCKVSSGSAFAVVAMILFFFCGVCVFCTPKPEPLRARKNVEVTSSASSGKPDFPMSSPTVTVEDNGSVEGKNKQEIV